MGTIFVLLFSILFGGSFELLPFANSQEKPTAFYCFVIPPERTSFDPNILSNISCTHFVYGSVAINNPKGRPEFSNWDKLYAGRDGNIRKFLRLRSIHRNAKFLLGVRRSQPFRDSVDASNVAKGVKKAYKEKRFDGVFVNFDGFHLEKHHSNTFMQILSANESVKPTIGVTAQRIWQFGAVDRLRQILPAVENIYVDMSTLPSNEDPYTVTQVDPLFANGSVHFEDTIQGTVDKLAEEGIMPQNVVIGFTAGGWQFKVKNVMNVGHGDFGIEKGSRLSYQETCKTRGTILFDNSTLNEITLNRQSWISSNLPADHALGKKMKWAMSEGYAGIGISSIFEDDPEGVCATDPLASHNLAMRILKETIPSSSAKCNRLCYLNEQHIDESFPFDSLKSEYCSHLVVNYINLDIQNTLTIVEKSDILIERINRWRRKVGIVAPRLILSVGSMQPTGTWSFILGNDLKRKVLVDEIIREIEKQKADGVELSWTMEPMNNEFDKNNLNSLVEELNNADEKNNIEIIVAATARNTFLNHYDVEFLNKSANLVVLHTHKLHTILDPLVGHPSPIRSIPSMKDQKMSLEQVAKYWIDKGMKRSRLVVSMSASAISMISLIDHKSSGSSPIGQPAFVSLLRSDKNDIKTQQEICESIKMGSSEMRWVDGAEVPLLVRNDQIVAYENVRSAHNKAVWASIEGLGMAVHDIHADDPNAVCDNRTAFPILNRLTRAHVCHKCIKAHDFRKCTHDFTISCSFDLKKSTPIFKTAIVPYERCTEVVVEQAKISQFGNVEFADSQQVQIVKNLTAMRKKMGKCGMIMSLSCGNSEAKLTNTLIKNISQTIDNILKSMDTYQFSGVLLDCANVVTRNNNIQFNNFIRLLEERIKSKEAPNGCKRTLSMRFSNSGASLYRISQLNKLHHISLSPFDKNSLEHQFLSNESTSLPSTEQLLSTWIQSGVKPEKIIIEMSPKGVRTSASKRHLMSQGEVCIEVGNRAEFVDNFDTLTANYHHKSDIISLPNINSFRYKIGFVSREKLAGIGFRSVNGDDFTGICGRGSFPILKSLYNNQICN